MSGRATAGPDPQSERTPERSVANVPPRSGELSAEPVGEVPARAAGGGLTILSDAEAQRSARAMSGRASAGPDPQSGVAAQPQAAVLRYLERSRVTGVRLSTTDPKVLFNDRVYRLNDVVDRDLQLRVVSIADRELRFQDAQGYVYTKSF